MSGAEGDPGRFAALPEPPYYAVIFSSLRTEAAGYDEMADRMMDLACREPGFLGAESTRDADGFGITVSYWRDHGAIAAWRRDAEHMAAQTMGREQFYAAFRIRIALVERSNDWDKPK